MKYMTELFFFIILRVILKTNVEVQKHVAFSV